MVERIVARDARVTPERRGVRLLRIPRVGHLRVGCDGDGRTSTTLVASDLSATSDVVVETGGDAVHGKLDPNDRFTPSSGPFAVGIQRWQIAAFAKAQVPVATISVAARPLDPDVEFAACAVSAQATVFQSTAGTITE